MKKYGILGLILASTVALAASSNDVTKVIKYIKATAASGTMTVPNATDTFVGKATTDVLTNKSISGSTNTITNVSLTTGVTGLLPAANGGFGIDLSATGGTSQVIKQTSLGGALTVARLACADLSNAATSCATDATNMGNASAGTLVVGRGGLGVTTTPANGQIPIGNGTNYTVANIASGAGVTVTNGAGTITISSSGAAPAYNYTAQVAAYNATISDYIVVSGSTFDIAFPTAVGQSGKSIVVRHNGAQGTTYCLTYNGAESMVDGTGTYSGGQYCLKTTGETVTATSTGAGWMVTNHFTQTGWVDGGANVITGTTSNPTKASGITTDKIYWRRNGQFATFRIVYIQSNTTSSATGSGDYKFLLPLTVNTSGIDLMASASGYGSFIQLLNSFGSGKLSSIATNGDLTAVLWDSTHVRLHETDTSSGGMIGSAGGPLTGASTSYLAEFTLPIVGWLP